MIVLDEQQLVFMAIPRTGCRSMRGSLKNRFRGEAGFRDVLTGWNGSGHGTRAPEGCEGYGVFHGIRNPYERMVAAFRMDSEKRLGGLWVRGFGAWLTGKDVHRHNAPISEYVDGYGVVATVSFYDLEHQWWAVTEELFGERLMLDWVGGGRSRDWWQALNQGLADIIYDLHGLDFERYGYGRDSWKR